MTDTRQLEQRLVDGLAQYEAIKMKLARAEQERDGYAFLINGKGQIGEQLEKMTAERDEAREQVKALREAMSYPLHGDTAKLLRKAAELLDRNCRNGLQSFLSPHLYRVAEQIDAALADSGKGAT